jgi:hypothetical protein
MNHPQSISKRATKIQFWTAIVHRYEESGMTQAAFARSSKIPYALHNPQRFAGSESVKELAHESTSCAV